MRAYVEYNIRRKSQRLADLKSRTAELERTISDARMSHDRELDRELAQFSCSRESALFSSAAAHDYFGGTHCGGEVDSPPARTEGRTEVLVNHGRASAYYPGLSRRRKITIATAVIAVAMIVLMMVLAGGGASWPPSVATVQAEATRACQNPDVKSEPGQVDFACAKATRQILWVFALMTSGDNPNFADARTGRLGLEPITPSQGGELAWSLNLHDPYSPANPVDSLEVAARAINNIVGGATVTGADGKPVVQSGLEGHSANCVRYTGSAAVKSRRGFPRLCAKPVTSPAGQDALVADIYRKWVVGAAPKAAQDAAVLFENAKDPGNPQVQAILKHLPQLKRPA